MIPIKNPQEIKIMENAGKILSDVLLEVIDHVKPGVTELELDSLAEKLIRKRGGEPGFQKVDGYHHSLCVATNDVVVHGIPTGYILKEGDVIGLDCGVYLDGFHTDMAETVYVGNKTKMSPSVSRFLDLGKKSMLLGIEAVKPGNRVGHISKAIQNVLEKKGGYGITRSLIGHGVGRELHEEPEIPGYLEGRLSDTPLLRTGMTIAVEVIYNMGSSEVMFKGSDDWTIVSADGSLGGLFERTVLVTETGHKVITES